VQESNSVRGVAVIGDGHWMRTLWAYFRGSTPWRRFGTFVMWVATLQLAWWLSAMILYYARRM
jgi:hypothetical protein